MQKVVLVLASLATLALTACGPVQSPECAQYLECQRAIDSEQGTSSAEGVEASYGEAGTCWTDSAEHAQNCTEACVAALDARASSYPDIDSCQPESEG